MTQNKKSVLAAAIVVAVILVIFKTPTEIIAGFITAITVGICVTFSNKPRFGFGVCLVMMSLTLVGGCTYGILPALDQGNFTTWNFGLGTMFGLLFSLLLDETRESLEGK